MATTVSRWTCALGRASAIAITLSDAITHTTAPACPAAVRSSHRISPAERTAAIARFMA
jgi:hypothetical protein